MVKKCKLDWEEVAWAMENHQTENPTFLDTHTGQTIPVCSEVYQAVENDDAEAIKNLSEWQKDGLEEAKQIINDTTDRYLEIPEMASYESYEQMRRFVDNLEDEQLREKLHIALEGPGAFQRFKNVLGYHTDQRALWFKYKDKRMKKEIRDWLGEKAESFSF